MRILSIVDRNGPVFSNNLSFNAKHVKWPCFVMIKVQKVVYLTRKNGVWKQ